MYKRQEYDYSRFDGAKLSEVGCVIRGWYFDHAIRRFKMCIRDRRMTGDMAGNLDYERFNLHAIDRVEIVKGASSTLYGSRAAGAVINLITKKTDKPLSIDAGIRYGQMNERNYKHPQPKDLDVYKGQGLGSPA